MISCVDLVSVDLLVLVSEEMIIRKVQPDRNK